MARPKADTKALTITIPGPVFRALEDHRWTVRMERPELITKALTEFLVGAGVDLAQYPEQVPTEAKGK